MNPQFVEIRNYAKMLWPCIGRQLDHPLAEWYFERNFARKSGQGKVILASLLFVMAFILFTMFYHYNGVYYFLLQPIFIALLVMHYRRSNIPPKNHPAYVFIKKKPHLIHELWLAGIHYRDLAAIAIMLRLHRRRSKIRRLLEYLLVNSIGVAVMCDFFKHNHDSMAVSVLLAISLLILYNLIVYMHQSPESIAQEALAEFNRMTNARMGAYGDIGTGAAMGCATIFMLFCLVFVYGAVCLVLEEYYRFEFTISFFVASGAAACLLFSLMLLWFEIKYQPGRTRYYFRDVTRTGQHNMDALIKSEHDANK